jgi:DNA primase
MQVRKNTKAFKAILEIFSQCRTRPDREKLVRLYITKAGDSLAERISIEGIQHESALFYEMNFQAIVTKLESSMHQLHLSEDPEGIYYFHSTSNKTWDENPFEFDETVLKVFKDLDSLPAVRKKEKVEKYELPVAQIVNERPVKAKEPVRKTAPMKFVPEEKQPGFKLAHSIQFTNLDRILFREPRLTKRDVLEYYFAMSNYILPHLRDRTLWVRGEDVSAEGPAKATAELLRLKDEQEIPSWLVKPRKTTKGEEHSSFVCNDPEHLLWLVEKGCIEFHSSLRRRTREPDCFVIEIESPDADLEYASSVALSFREIIDGLRLPAFIKTDGRSSLHIHFPLVPGSSRSVVEEVAVMLCRLMALKSPDRVSFNEAADKRYGKAELRILMNEDHFVAPYSLVTGHSAGIALPLHWEELQKVATVESELSRIKDRVKKKGDPFDGLFKKKINADELLEHLGTHYKFLF